MITVDAFPGKNFHGKVVRIATRGINISNVVTFEVKIEVLDQSSVSELDLSRHGQVLERSAHS